MPKTLAELQTPSLILDRQKMQRNIDRMAARAKELGVPLRPHLKTPKSVHIAKHLQDAGAKGFNVSTLQEAEYFYEGGFDDLYYCVPFAPIKAARAAALAAKGCTLTLMTDSMEGVEACIAAAEAVGPATPLRFTLELDVDGYRCGMPWQGNDFIEAAQRLAASSATEFVGIMSYGGASYGKTPEGAAELTTTHLAALRDTASRLEAAGVPCEMISFGSSPAVLHSKSMEGVTEARCGIYTFQDLFQAGIGACAVDDIAVSVLTSVIARQPQHNRFVIDAGGMGLSKDRSTMGHPFDAQYGLVCDSVTGKPIGDLAVTTVSQEIGLVTSLSGKEVDLSAFEVGSTVRVLPNHADMTAAAYEDYFVVDGDDQIQAHWTRQNYWT